jgi:hypothetical protein
MHAMPTIMDISIQEAEGFMRVRASGRPSAEEMIALIHDLGRRSGAWKHDKLLIDLRGVDSLFGFSQQSSMGLTVAEALSLVKVASLVPVHRRTGVSQKTSDQHGGHLRVFIDEGSAVQWLAAKE